MTSRERKSDTRCPRRRQSPARLGGGETGVVGIEIELGPLGRSIVEGEVVVQGFDVGFGIFESDGEGVLRLELSGRGFS